MSGAALRALTLEFLEELEVDGRAAVTAKRYGAYLRTFVDWLATTTGTPNDTVALDAIDAEALRRYRLFLARRRDPGSGQVIGAGTRNLYQVALRNFLRYCRRRKLDTPDPEEHLQLARERDREIRHLTRDEALRVASAVRLDDATGLRDRAVIEMLFGTAVRVSELCAMTRRQVNLDRREAEVVGKGGKARLVLLTNEAAHWLRRYVETRTDGSAHLFVSNRKDDDGEPRALSVRQVQRIVDEAARRAGLPFRISPHWFRHSRLTVLARHAGVEAAQRIAGHSSLQTTSRYLHVTDDHLRRAFDEAERKERGS
ncbi:MAG TPA: tyrosine-type recombinase/integrase [Candidatus Limnocylindria bacterium]|nr:tyrosine-type recombinase/integrase [Candidatus Limnocylindria bacterium]